MFVMNKTFEIDLFNLLLISELEKYLHSIIKSKFSSVSFH
jgi:hypothetical protein